MALTVDTQDEAAIELARECLYRFLSAAFSNPRRPRFQQVIDHVDQEIACRAAQLLREESLSVPTRMALGELPPDALSLEEVCEQLNQSQDDLLADYDRVFGFSAARGCPPFETEYHPNSDPFFRSQQMADVAGFYRAFGLAPSTDIPERPDHIVLELEFMAFLLLKQRLAQAGELSEFSDSASSVCAEAHQNFFNDHLAWWLPAFASGLRRHVTSGYYLALSRVLSSLVHVERRLRKLDTPTIPGIQEPTESPEIPGACGDCTSNG